MPADPKMELIGRESELADVADRLGARRLVTVTGPAGIGKTAVAQAVADRLGPSYELGAHHIDLTRVDAPEAVGGALAGQLGFKSFDALLASPTEAPALVVVDNCEHLTAAAADAVAELLAACRSPSVLATSRAPLDLPDESLVVLGPLAVPPVGTDELSADAVRLFLRRVRDAGASIPPDQLHVVAELCRRLDGVPLALELAAARTRMLRPVEILARLSEGVDVLARPRYRGTPHHRSLSETIDWSYHLLPADAAALFSRLGLFAGPFTFDLAVQVGVDAGLDVATAGDALTLLVDVSLVVAESAADATSFRLLQTVRSYAEQRLRDAGVFDDARDCLVDHVVDAAVGILAAGGRRWDMSVLAQLLSLYDNLTSALRWCLSQDTDERRSMLLGAVLWGVVHQAHTEEVAALCEEVLASWPDSEDPYVVDTVATVVTARCIMGDPAGALELAERTLPRAEQYPTAPITLRRAMGYAARALGDRAGARQCFTEVAVSARERGLLALALEAEVALSQLVAEDGQLDAALDLAAAAQAEAAAEGSTVNEVWARSVAAHLRLHQDLRTGMAEVVTALEEARRIDYPAVVSANLRSLAWARIRTGEHHAAAVALMELFDGLLARRGVADLRGALFVTAELLHGAGTEAWASIAATATSLPEVGLIGRPFDDVAHLPVPEAAPLSRREATVLARRELTTFLDGTVSSSAPGPTAPTARSRFATPPAAGVAEAAAARLVDRGGYWEAVFNGYEASLKGSKGLVDLRQLLAEPGREIHCLDLMGAGVEESSTGEVLDDTARRAYEERIRDLQADLDQAETDNDFARAERAQVELDTLVDHLTGALGLGGRARRGGGSAERARSAVTQRIRSTIRTLEAEHPALGRHLAVSVSTGTYCVYRPEHPTVWETTST